jgi:hypothetical protein
MRVFSVASRAAFPELPLASAQNLKIPASLDTSGYTRRLRRNEGGLTRRRGDQCP